MDYRKWSVPADVAKQINQTCAALGYDKRGLRWNLLTRLVAYAKEHPSLFSR